MKASLYSKNLQYLTEVDLQPSDCEMLEAGLHIKIRYVEPAQKFRTYGTTGFDVHYTTYLKFIDEGDFAGNLLLMSDDYIAVGGKARPRPYRQRGKNNPEIRGEL